jgi:hypothetical protein
MNYTVTKSGSNKTFKIENGESIRHAMPSRCFVTVGDDGVMTVRATNKAEAAAVEFAIKNAMVKTEPKLHVSENGAVAVRRVVLASMATGKTGKSWYATGKNVDEMQLPPEWEGELICYEYSN